MCEYKFYFVERNGHISRPPAVREFPDDHAAIEYARSLNAPCDVEIWDGPRLLTYIAGCEAQ